MRVTQWGEYGILFSVYLARRAREGTATVGAAEIARSQGIDLQYAQQILQRLRKGGIVDSVRGPAGGYHLCKPAETITLGDVLIATEGETFEIICEAKPVNPERCKPESECGLRALWHELKDHVDTFLKKYTIYDLSDKPGYTYTEISTAMDSASFPEAAPVQIGARRPAA